MNINGTDQVLFGKSFADLGKYLQEASPAKDGLGLKVELTEDEEGAFVQHFGWKVGYALCDIIADAVRLGGGDPAGLTYTYSNRTFVTPAAA